jgi:hypothetical protein
LHTTCSSLRPDQVSDLDRCGESLGGNTGWLLERTFVERWETLLAHAKRGRGGSSDPSQVTVAVFISVDAIAAVVTWSMSFVGFRRLGPSGSGHATERANGCRASVRYPRRSDP